MRPISPLAPRWAAALPLVALLWAGCDTAGLATSSVSTPHYAAAGGARLSANGEGLVAEGPAGAALIVAADAPSAALLFRSVTLDAGGVLEAALVPAAGGPGVSWRSARGDDGHALSVQPGAARLMRIEGVGSDGSLVSVPAADVECGPEGCKGGTTTEGVGSVHYTRVCDEEGECVLIVTYDYVGSGEDNVGSGGPAQSTRWVPPGGRAAVPVTEVRFVLEGPPELDALRRLRLTGFRRLEVAADRFAE